MELWRGSRQLWPQRAKSDSRARRSGKMQLRFQYLFRQYQKPRTSISGLYVAYARFFSRFLLRVHVLPVACRVFYYDFGQTWLWGVRVKCKENSVRKYDDGPFTLLFLHFCFVFVRTVITVRI